MLFLLLKTKIHSFVEGVTDNLAGEFVDCPLQEDLLLVSSWVGDHQRIPAVVFFVFFFFFFYLCQWPTALAGCG